MMKHFKLAMIAILLIIGCMLSHAQMDNESNSLVENNHELRGRTSGSNGHGGGGHGSSSGRPTSAPTTRPTRPPTRVTPAPTQRATPSPTQRATPTPTQRATPAPTQRATPAPTTAPTSIPTTRPTTAPTTRPSTTGLSSVNLCGVVPTSQEPLKLLVPLYVYPGAAWDAVAAGASKVGTIAIVNPNSGPAASPDSSYNSYMSKLKNAGVEMIGYVYTSYGARSIADVKKDIDTYASKYPLLTGIFFDEASDSASEIAFYTEAYNYVLSKGYKHSIINPGVQPAAGYVDIATSIVIFENSGSSFSASKSFSSFVTCASNSVQKAGYKYKFAGIAHSSSSSSASSIITNMRDKGMGLVYVTDGAAGCCTYNQLVSYYSSMVSSVQALN